MPSLQDSLEFPTLPRTSVLGEHVPPLCGWIQMVSGPPFSGNFSAHAHTSSRAVGRRKAEAFRPRGTCPPRLKAYPFKAHLVEQVQSVCGVVYVVDIRTDRDKPEQRTGAGRAA